MRILLILQALVFAVVAIALPSPASAQSFLGNLIGSLIGLAPPSLPYYQQPDLTQPNEIWQPGYWQYGSQGYYWVPGTWVQPPQTGLLWTPGYWAQSGNGYYWQQGYWANSVGYYGDVNYGNGYYGNGYAGGAWQGNQFRYNTAVSNVNTTIIRNVYINRTVVVHNNNRVSYYGGRGGLHTGPTSAQMAVSHMHHYGMTSVQTEHMNAARQNRSYLDSVNHGHPAQAAVARPLSTRNISTHAAPVQPRPATHQQSISRPTTVQRAPAQRAPAQRAPVQRAPVQRAPVQRAPVQRAPVQRAPVQRAAPMQRAPVQRAPVQRAPMQRAPVQRAPVQRAPAQRAPAQRAPAQRAPANPKPARTPQPRMA
jgi:hypothetical protein